MRKINRTPFYPVILAVSSLFLIFFTYNWKSKTPSFTTAAYDNLKFENELREVEKKVANTYTMLSPERRWNVVETVKKAIQEGIEGDFLEAGVWMGGGSMLAKATINALGSKKQVYLCDSFKGLPEKVGMDNIIQEEKEKPMDPVGSYDVGGVDTVKQNFVNMGLLDDRIHFVEGFFNETLPKLKIGPLAVLRMDGDLYSSTIDILDNLYHKVSRGGYVIIDDYGHWPQCKKAVHDWFDQKGLTKVLDGLKQIDYTGVYFKKP